MKFQVGDRVVIVSDLEENHLGQSGYVTGVTQDTYYPYILSIELNPWRESELELAEVYYSPLYQALKEDT